MHHTWCWIQVAYYNRDLLAYAGNFHHEYVRFKPKFWEPDKGQSAPDYRAGVWGINVGSQLQRGQLSLADLALKLRVDLGN